MKLVNEKVEHIKFGTGVIKELNDNRILVQFQDKIGTKLFLYPEAFKDFLKAKNAKVENNILKELRKKEQIELKIEQQRKEREALELEERIAKLKRERKPAKRKSAAKTKRKKA